MDWKKIAPWNWFKEEEHETRVSPAATDLARVHDPMNALRSEMARLFDNVLRGSFPRQLEPFSAFDREDSALVPVRPNVDISEGRKAYTVRVELPGIERDDVSIEIEEGNRLILRAEKRQEHEEEGEGYHCVESRYGAVQRILSLPDDADVDAIEAKFKNGVLKLKIPKHPAQLTKTRAIEVEGG